MAELHKALECLRPKDFSNVPTDNLKSFLPEILSSAELIANSVPPPPNGTPYESAQRTRTSPQPAANAADLTKSDVRRPPVAKEHEALQKSWGKPVKLGAQQAATGMSVYKMAGHDRHGAWFARSSVHEGLGFAKWKRMMQREFPESLEVQGGPGEGNIRGIGGDQRLEEMTVDGVGNLQGEVFRRQVMRMYIDEQQSTSFLRNSLGRRPLGNSSRCLSLLRTPSAKRLRLTLRYHDIGWWFQSLSRTRRLRRVMAWCSASTSRLR
jgi:hypothetical protein